MYSFELHGLVLFGLPIWIITRGLILLIRKRKGIRFNIGSEILTNLFVVYLFLLLGVTILPIYIGGIPHLQELSFIEKCNIHLVPFVDYFNEYMILDTIIRNVVGNLVLLMPFILYSCIKYAHIRDFKSSALLAFLISFSIEMIQLITNILGLSDLRAVHVEDLILNTVGGIIAWCVFKLVYKEKARSTTYRVYPQYIK